MPGTRPGTTAVHRQGKVTVRIARPMGRRTCDVFLLSGSRLRGAVVAVSCGYDFGQYTPRADDSPDGIRTFCPVVRRQSNEGGVVAKVALVLGSHTPMAAVLCFHKVTDLSRSSPKKNGRRFLKQKVKKLTFFL